jgi:hypothetical protein
MGVGFLLETDILKKEVQLGLAAIWDSINTLSILIFYFRSSALGSILV